MSKSRGFCFTVNNWTDARLQLITDYARANSAYCIIGDERGENGTPHLQGYIYFRCPRAFTSVANSLGEPRAHVERARGSPNQNKEYCSKQHVIFEHGECPQQGRRIDLENIRKCIENGATDVEIASQSFATWCQYGRRFSDYRRLLQVRPRRWKSVVVWIWGETGTGKTRFVHELDDVGVKRQINVSLERYEGSVVDDLRGLYIAVDPSFSWTDGYEGQDSVLIDDYRGECPLASFLRLLDRYPMQVPVKGGFTEWSPKIIYITSNLLPRSCYASKTQEELAPLYRRIDYLFEKTKEEFIDISNKIRF